MPWQPQQISNHVEIIPEIFVYLLSSRIYILLVAYNKQLLEYGTLFLPMFMCYFHQILDFEYDIILINFSLLRSQFLPLFQRLVTCGFKFGIKILRTVAAFRE